MRQPVRAQRRKDFDPKAQYVATSEGSVKLEGRPLLPGETVPSGALTERDMMLFYVHKKIAKKGSSEDPGPHVLEGTRIVPSGQSAAPEFQLSDRGHGWYEIVDQSGKVYSEKKMRRDEAEQELASLNGA